MKWTGIGNGKLRTPAAAMAAGSSGEPSARQAAHIARQMAKTYFDQALAFEQSKHDTQKQMTRIAWRVAIAAGALALVSILGSAGLVLLKKPTPPVVIRDNTATGNVTVIDVARSGAVKFGELEDRADLRRYVELRESYDWETIQDAFDTVTLLNSPREQDMYAGLYNHPNAPQKVLTDKFRVIAKVGAITFVGTTAQVFFSKKILALSGSVPPKTEYWVATITYDHADLPASSHDLTLNPTGFKVTSYLVDRDWTRSAGDGTTGVAAPNPATAGGAR
ncbi:virB8 family protein [Burkholderia alba]|uniref:virB8 family protein n=1 Tax=Burkholderia alba TaxID=2683677 RepID=UPI002B052159|nr:VirB8/TrbF family protein [Burkholderia alba]